MSVERNLSPARRYVNAFLFASSRLPGTPHLISESPFRVGPMKNLPQTAVPPRGAARLIKVQPDLPPPSGLPSAVSALVPSSLRGGTRTALPRRTAHDSARSLTKNRSIAQKRTPTIADRGSLNQIAGADLLSR